jgi:dethiobiotin synthetase
MIGALPAALRRSLFIAGTDTGVGKTFVATRLLAALAAAGYRAAGMKPVAAGAEMTSHGLRNDDALDLAAAGNVRLPYELTNPVCLALPTSPHLAAESAGKGIEIAAIVAAFQKISTLAEVVVAEGAGGWYAPIGPPAGEGQRGPTMQDIALALDLPVLLVVGLRLGCINHALLTAEAIRRSGLPLAGWIANPVDQTFNEVPRYVDSLRQRLPEPLLWTAPAVILPGQ